MGVTSPGEGVFNVIPIKHAFLLFVLGNRRQKAIVFCEKAACVKRKILVFFPPRNSFPAIPPISVCLGLAGGVVKGAPVLRGAANP